MGLKLFVRYRAGVKPTIEAEVLYSTLTKIKKVWAISEKNNFGNLETKTIKIGAHQAIAQTYFGKILNYIYANHNDIHLELVLGTSFEITNKIQSREIDIGLVANPVKSKDLIIRKYIREEIELCGQSPQETEITLLYNSQMVFIAPLLKKLSFAKTIDLSDYNTAASICSTNKNCWAILPSSVRKRYPELSVIKNLKSAIDIKLVTYPGSPIVGWLSEIRYADTFCDPKGHKKYRRT